MGTISEEKIITVSAAQVKAEADALCIVFDGKQLRFPWAALSARLAAADEKQRANFTVSPSGYGIHWNEIDEDISIHALLK